MPFLGNMKRYADNGGRMFADHLHSIWIRTGLPPWPATATWIGVGDDLPTPVDRQRRHLVPEGRRAGRLAGQHGQRRRRAARSRW